MKLANSILIFLVTTFLLGGCGGGGYKSEIQAKNAVVWRGQTYYACQDKVDSILAFEKNGGTKHAPVNSAGKDRLWQHLTYLIDLKMEPECLQQPRAGQLSLAIIENTKSSGNFLSALTSNVPPEVAAKGKWGTKFYEQSLLRGASKQDLVKFANDGTMSEWIKLAQWMD